MKINLTLLFVFAIVLYSCGSAASRLYNPTEANAAKANVSVETLLEGKVLYLNKCNECHNLYKPTKLSSEEWNSSLNKMQERAKISDAEKKKIHTYLTSEIME